MTQNELLRTLLHLKFRKLYEQHQVFILLFPPTRDGRVWLVIATASLLKVEITQNIHSFIASVWYNQLHLFCFVCFPFFRLKLFIFHKELFYLMMIRRAKIRDSSCLLFINHLHFNTRILARHWKVSVNSNEWLVLILTNLQ